MENCLYSANERRGTSNLRILWYFFEVFVRMRMWIRELWWIRELFFIVSDSKASFDLLFEVFLSCLEPGFRLLLLFPLTLTALHLTILLLFSAAGLLFLFLSWAIRVFLLSSFVGHRIRQIRYQLPLHYFFPLHKMMSLTMFSIFRSWLIILVECSSSISG